MHGILVPVDGSDHALKALHIACDLAEKYGGKIALLHVLVEGRQAADLLGLKVAKSFGPKLRTALQEAAAKTATPIPLSLLKTIGQQILDQAAERVQRRGLQSDSLDMTLDAPADAILAAQKRIGAGTIVMGCRGVSDAGGSSFGSVSNVVFAKAKCTCLSVK